MLSSAARLGAPSGKRSGMRSWAKASAMRPNSTVRRCSLHIRRSYLIRACRQSRGGGSWASHVQIGDVERIFLDELASRLDDVAHQPGEDLVGDVGLGDLDLEKGAVGRVQRRLPELVGVHLAKALVALDGETLAAGGEDRLQKLGRTGDQRAARVGRLALRCAAFI